MVRASAAALLLLLAGCSAPPADKGKGLEHATQAPTLDGSESNVEDGAETTERRGSDLTFTAPIRSTAPDDVQTEIPAPPARLQIPSIDIDLEVRAVGVAADGWMEVPENPAVVGWYRFGPPPGSVAGAAVLAAHVDSLRYGLGPFVRLKSLPLGAEVLVINGAGGTTLYQVDEIVKVGKAELASADVFERSGAPTLHLVTCGGTFDSVRRTYSDNVIVVASPVDR